MATMTQNNITRRTFAKPSNLERYAYTFMRVSGLALLFLAVGHMVIQHVLNSSTTLTMQFVADQWDAIGWKIYDIFLLIFAISHGINGLRNVLEDYIHNRVVMKRINRILAVFVVITIIWAAVAIMAFDPDAARALRVEGS